MLHFIGYMSNLQSYSISAVVSNSKRIRGSCDVVGKGISYWCRLQGQNVFPMLTHPLSWRASSVEAVRKCGTSPFRIIRHALFAIEKVELCESRIMTPVNTHISPNLF